MAGLNAQSVSFRTSRKSSTVFRLDQPCEVAKRPARSEVFVPSPRQIQEIKAIEQLTEDTANRMTWASEIRRNRRRLRTSIILFLLTFLSTTLVGADYWPVDILFGAVNPDYGVRVAEHLNRLWPGNGAVVTLWERFWQSIAVGCTYSVPLMTILFCHEMGHYLQAVRYRVPASFPYFIPLPLPPLGTMGAVILQGRGVADRKQMFDIAVSGPIAGLIVTLPVLFYGIQTSSYIPIATSQGFDFGQSLLVRWMIEMCHGPAPAGMTFAWNGFATAGWVGVFITAMNLLPVGQLDGGHLMYTLIGRKAHLIAWGLILLAAGVMIYNREFSYVLLLILVTLTGPRHPPTANDRIPLGLGRHLIGWATLSFLLIGFTAQPIMLPESRPATAVPATAVPATEVAPATGEGTAELEPLSAKQISELAARISDEMSKAAERRESSDSIDAPPDDADLQNSDGSESGTD